MVLRKKLLPLSILLFLLGFSRVFAAGTEIKYPSVFGFSLPPSPTLLEYIQYIDFFAIAVSGLVAFGIALYGGFRYLISVGNPATKADARDQISAAILGLVVLFLSFIILNTINPQFVSFPNLESRKLTIPEQPVPPPPATEQQKNIAFQIPLGKIIDRLTTDSPTRNRLNLIRTLSALAQQQSQDLQNLTAQLQSLVNACNCGASTCGAGSSPPPSPSKPDLIVTNFTLSNANPAPGEVVTGTFNIKNVGSGSVLGATWWWVDIYQHQPGTIPCGLPDGEMAQPFGFLTQGDTTGPFSLTFTTPATPGTYAAKIFIDSDCSVDEENETNNQYQAIYSAWSILGAPSVNLTAWPTNITSGEKTTLSWTVSDGTYCTASGPWFGYKNAGGGSEALTVTGNNEFKRFYLDCTGPAGSGSDWEDVYVNSAPPVDCAAGASCNVACDTAAIQAKIDQIKNSPEMQALLATQQKIIDLRAILEEDILDLYKAATLMNTISDEIMDYYTFSIWREELSRLIIPVKVAIQTYPGWEDIRINDDGLIVNDPDTFYFWVDDPDKKELIAAIGSIGGGVNIPDDLFPPGGITPPTLIPGQFIWPTMGYVAQEFGSNPGFYGALGHPGMDIANVMGTPIWAPADGIVYRVNNPGPCDTGGICFDGSASGAGLGRWILMRHPNATDPTQDIYSLLAHLGSIYVSEDQIVKQGDVIATMDSSGLVCPAGASGSHLHLEMYVGLVGVPDGQYCTRRPSTSTLINPRLIIPGDPSL